VLPLPWPFEREYMQLALVAGLVVGACAPLIGTFVVQKQMSLLGDGIGHMAFAGVALGALTGVWPIWTALAVSVAGALTIEHLRSRGRASGDLALAIFFYGGIAAGVVLIGVAGALDANLFGYLFGSILTVTRGEVLVIVAMGAVVVVTVGLLGRALFSLSIDEEWSRVAGLPVALLNNVLAVLIAVTIVAAMRVVGLLLVAALMVLPVASGQILGRSRRRALVCSALVGTGSVVVGLTAARRWGLAPGGTIVLVTVAVFAVVSQLDTARRIDAVQRIMDRGRDAPVGSLGPVELADAGRDDDHGHAHSHDQPGSH
jgi:zinc transport system permease protein